MTTTLRLGLGYLRSDMQPGVDVSLIWVHDFTLEQHQEFEQHLKTIKEASRRPMLEIVEVASATLAAALDRFADDRKSAVAAKRSVELDQEARIAAFATVNAAYAFQEHAKATAIRAGGERLWNEVNAVFANVYHENVCYLVAYKLRQLFVHDAIGAVRVNSQSKREADGVVDSVDCYVDRSYLKARLTGRAGQWVIDREADLSVADLMGGTLAGMEEVFRRTRAMLFPELTESLAFFDPWRPELLNAEYALCLTRVTLTDSGEIGPMKFKQVRPDDLLNAGMAPLTAQELASSSELALNRICRAADGALDEES
ncbi:hypothetical protein QI633_07835 [Nocardioides sp. QY071]|uniref:hypothetical protein n=1 Tax=Nocardioides sp. QY071 TaxID=3044187 RepID=UPI00249BEB7A|nr:hypothetical protein [Nocardioides sp. QY071]WGY03666.1 hypothetical protein QI633_07835 [Nocardioides sp. QY071]